VTGWLVAIGGIGGLVVLLTSIVVIGRAIFRQVTATEENTRAVRELAASVGKLDQMFNNHETRITVLEDRIKR
jgi:hypothetical protein